MSELRIMIKGRLGNQMFIYAFARALSFEKRVEPILLDNWMRRKGIANRLDCFNLSPEVKFGHGRKMGLVRSLLNTISKKRIKKTELSQRHSLELRLNDRLAKFGLFRNTFGYAPLPPMHKLESRDFYMEGYFQSERYFSKYKSQILNDFTFGKDIVDSCKMMASEIQNAEEPTCLHVRLGDYLNNPLHGVANAEYYKKALRLLKERKPQAKVFLFSDNISLAKKELDLGDDVVCLPDDYDEQQTMYLGSLCKNFIISNSSFSWWMQYLSAHDDKQVFAPNRWYAADVPCDLYLDGWNLIEV